MQQIDHMADALLVLLVMLVGMLEHTEIADQQEPAYSRARHAIDQRVDGMKLFTRVIRCQRRQQAYDRRAPCCTLFGLVGILEPAMLAVQARPGCQLVEIVDDHDHFVLALEQLGHQRTAQAAQGAEQRDLEGVGFGIFHVITPLRTGDCLTPGLRPGFAEIQEFSCRGSRVITPTFTTTPAPWSRPGSCVKRRPRCFR
ncbi:hypothetical protein D3C80_1557410 [compost metagenome]